jgi:hypothetical protein
MRKTLVAVAALLAVATTGAAGAQAATSSTLKESFSTKKHNTRGSVKLALTVGPAAGPLAPPTTQDVDYLPAGTTYNANGFTFCAPATLTASGPSACPAASKIGSGSSTVAVMLGGNPEQETAPITAVATGPTSFVLWGHGSLPIPETVQIPATVAFTGNVMSVSLTVPLIPTFPGLPDASVQSMNMTIGNGKLVQTPKVCRGGKWSFKNVMTFNDGSTTTATSSQKC